MKPYLVEESTDDVIPSHLDTLIKSTVKEAGDVVDVYDVMVSVVFVLTMETGFTPLKGLPESFNFGYEFNVAKLRCVKKLPANWRLQDRSSYCILFTLQPFPDYTIEMNATRNKTDHCLHVTLSTTSTNNENSALPPTTEISFHPRQYVTNVNIVDTAHMFTDLHRFAVEFKNNVSLPVRNGILLLEDVMHGSIEGIPLEVKRKIFQYLSWSDVLELSRTCKALHVCLQEQGLWKSWFQRYFGQQPSFALLLKTNYDGIEVNWRENFVRCHHQQLHIMRQMLHSNHSIHSDSSTEEYFYDVEADEDWQ